VTPLPTPHPWHWPRAAPIAWFWTVTALAAVAIALSMTFLDHPLALWLKARGEDSMNAFRLISQPGDSVWYLVGAGLGAPLAYVLARRAAEPMQARLLHLSSRLGLLFLAVAATGLAVDLAKILIGRARPRHLFESGITGFAPGSLASSWWSFPSGHATTIGAVAMTLTLLFPRLAWVWLALALAVAIGRIGATVHFVSDTIAGLWFGALGALIVSWLLAQRAEAIQRRWGLPRCVG